MGKGREGFCEKVSLAMTMKCNGTSSWGRRQAHLCWPKTDMVYSGLYNAMYTFYAWNQCSPKGQNKNQGVEMPGKHV